MSDQAESEYRFSFRQTQLEEICGTAETQLVTPEIHTANDFYGQAATLKRYAGVPLDRPLKAVVEHGVHLDDIVWQLDMDAPVGTLLSCSPWRAEVHRQNSNKHCEPIGFGYLYAKHVVQELAGEDPDSSHRRGTLAFPVHSTHTISAQFFQAAYAKSLASLAEEFQPVYVCGYWKDILDGNLHEYERRGIPIVTCGHMYDPDFMLRFHDLCRHFRFAVSNAIGTHLFQAVASGCRFFFHKSSEIHFDIPESDRPHCGQFNPMFQAAEREAESLFSVPNGSITDAQQAFVDRYIGTAYQRSPVELKRLIEKLEWWDRTRPRSTQLGNGLSIYAPPALARRAVRPVQRWHKIKRSVTKRLPGGKRTA